MNFISLQNKKLISGIIFALIFSLWLNNAVIADSTDEATQVDFFDVANLAALQNLDIKLAKEHSKEAKGDYISSYASFFPSIRGQLSGEKFNGGEVVVFAQPVQINRKTYRPTLSADYQIFTGGKSFFQVGIYKNQYKQTQSAYDRTLQKAILDSGISYFTWLRNFSNVGTANQSLKLAESQLAVNESRVKSGFGSEFDITQTQAIVAERKNLLLQAENDRDVSEVNLISMLNLDFTKKIAPKNPEIVPINFFEQEIVLPALFDIAQKNRPDLQETVYTLRQAKNEFGSAVSDLFPTVNLSAYIRGIGPGLGDLTRTTDGAFSVNVDLLRYLGVNIAGNIAATKAKVRQAIINKERLLNSMYKEITTNYYAYNLYKQQMAVTQEKINAAKEEYSISLSRLKTGVGINLDVIQAQRDYTQAYLEYQNLAANYNAAQLQLLYSVGMLTPDVINKAAKRFKQ